MKAVCWHGRNDVRVDSVPDPEILNPHDAVVRISSTAICGSDLHLYDGYIPTMQKGDVLGHEFMGEVVDVGPEVRNLNIGDRVVVPFTISCGQCWYCKQQLYSMCDNTNPNAWMLEAAYGAGGAGIFGYSHMMGGYAGGQAEYARVPFADVGPIKVPDHLSDEKVLFLSDILPTGYQAADNCNIHPGDVVAVWGCGPVGQFAIRSALMLGAHQVIAIDHVPDRLHMANGSDRITHINFDDEDVYERIMDLTSGRGADSCIDAVGLEAHGMTLDAVYDRVKVATFMATDRGHALRQAIRCCRKGGTLSIPGVYGGFVDKFPIGAVFGKQLTIRCGQTNVQRYMKPLLDRITGDEIQPETLITHRIRLEDAPDAYEMFKHKRDHCVKAVIENG